MKHIPLLIAFLFSAASPRAAAFPEPADQVQSQFEYWCSSKISILDLREVSFRDAYDRLAKDWSSRRGHGSFPLSLESFEADPAWQGPAAEITMSLKDVPFYEAMDLICKAAGKRLVPKAGIFHIERDSAEDNWGLRTYRLSPELLKALDFEKTPNQSQLFTVYDKRGIRIDSWAKFHLEGEKLMVFASDKSHAQIETIHLLLEKGYTITPPKPATSP